MEMLYYNIDWLKELGYDAPPTTPEEFKEVTCKAAAQPFSKATAQGSIGYELSIDASRFATWTFAFGGDVFDYNTSQFTINSKASQEAMAFLQDLFDSGCAALVTEDYGDQTDFGAGKTLFAVSSSSGLPFFQQAADEGAGFEWSVAAIPHTTPEPVMNVYGASVSIPKTTPESELAAWLFVKYYTSPEVQAKWAIASEYFPVRESVAKDLTSYFAEHPAYKTAFDLLEFGHFEPPVPGYDFIRTVIGEDMAAIVDGADVQKTLDEGNQQANEILSEQMSSPLPAPEPTAPPAEPAATSAPAASDLGTEKNPIIWVFVPSGELERVTTGAETVADQVFDMTGLVINTFVATDGTAAVEAMCANPPKAQMGSLNTFNAIAAADRGCADAALVAIRNDAPTYTGQIFTRVDSGINSLADLKGKTFCGTEPTSTSGWIIPSIMLRAAGVDTQKDLKVTYAGSHDAAVAGVYNGDCDAGASYVDARSRIEGDYPDVMEKVKIIETSIPIPNDGVQFVPSFSEELRTQIVDALLKIAETEEGKEALGAAYQWAGLQKIDDSFYDPFRQVLDAAGVSAEDF
jgi:phosphate/phosphite/phosphonate ABC transporter binding protein